MYLSGHSFHGIKSLSINNTSHHLSDGAKFIVCRLNIIDDKGGFHEISLFGDKIEVTINKIEVTIKEDEK